MKKVIRGQNVSRQNYQKILESLQTWSDRFKKSGLKNFKFIKMTQCVNFNSKCANFESFAPKWANFDQLWIQKEPIMTKLLLDDPEDDPVWHH